MKSARAYSIFVLVLVAASLVGLPVPRANADQMTIRAIAMGQANGAANPAGAAWKRIPSATLSLVTAPAVHPSISGTASARHVSVQSIEAEGRVFFRLKWRDSTKNASRQDTFQFFDGVAIQFPLDGKTDTAILMGNPGNRVNIWYWRADGRVQNLFADGFGTLTLAPVQDVSGRGNYANGAWTVVFSRPSKAAASDEAQFDGIDQIPVAVAVWNGSNHERDGFKAVTLEWQSLVFGKR